MTLAIGSLAAGATFEVEAWSTTTAGAGGSRLISKYLGTADLSGRMQILLPEFARDIVVRFRRT